MTSTPPNKDRAPKRDLKYKGTIIDNKKARFDYEILQTFEAGLVLTGSEVKSLRQKQIQLKDAYVAFRGTEAFLQNAHIAPYKASSYNNHEPERLRKLLLHSGEILRLQMGIQQKGLTCVPLKMYFNNKGRVKIEIGLARGKKHHDKREDLKRKQVERELRQERQRRNHS